MWSSEDDIILSAASYYVDSKLNNKTTSLFDPKWCSEPPPFQLAGGDAYSKNCGKIFMTINNLLVFHCTLCSKRYGTLFNFLQHISAKHLYTHKQSKKLETNTAKENATKDAPTTDLEPVYEYVALGVSRQAVVDKPSLNKKTKKNPVSKKKNKTAKQDGRKEEETVNLDKPSLNKKNDKKSVVPKKIETARQEDKKEETVNLGKVAEKEPGDIESGRCHDEASISSLEDLEPTMESKSSLKALPHKCDKCDKAYAKKSSLRVHILSHSNVKNYKCTFCEAPFKYKNNLRMHLVRHTTGKKVNCDLCEKLFYSKTEARIHKRTHTGEKPYVCFKCGRPFKTSGTLADHMKYMHDNIRTKKCDFCEKTFFNTYQLKNHMAVHSNERPYVCTHCSANFARQKTLAQHMKLHINAKEYKCNLCDKSFNQIPALISHRNINHKVLDFK